MKKTYTMPQIDVETFEVTDVITVSGLGGDEDKRDPIELPNL